MKHLNRTVAALSCVAIVAAFGSVSTSYAMDSMKGGMHKAMKKHHAMKKGDAMKGDSMQSDAPAQ